MLLIDTHQHFWDLRRFSYSWCAGIPPLNRSFLLSDYVAAARDTGITKTVFVECDVDQPHALDEARLVQSLAEENSLIAGIVAGVRPENEGFAAQLEALAMLPMVRGVRRVLHTQPDTLSQTPRFVENLRLLSSFGFTFDLCVLARQLPLALALAQACPHVHFILDHCGVPDVKARMLDPWRAHIAAMAALPNVSCKISGLVAYADDAWTVADLEPWIAHVLEKFGWDRVVWGGDWPVCTPTSTLARWVEATTTLVGAVNPAQREKLFFRNAARIYRV